MLKLIKFGASWCGPCRSLVPILEELKSRLIIEEIDVDEVDPVVLTNYKIRNIPVLIITKDNVEVWRHVGSISKAELENKLKEYETN